MLVTKTGAQGGRQLREREYTHQRQMMRCHFSNSGSSQVSPIKCPHPDILTQESPPRWFCPRQTLLLSHEAGAGTESLNPGGGKSYPCPPLPDPHLSPQRLSQCSPAARFCSLATASERSPFSSPRWILTTPMAPSPPCPSTYPSSCVTLEPLHGGMLTPWCSEPTE
jgi:hypothetical protein